MRGVLKAGRPSAKEKERAISELMGDGKPLKRVNFEIDEDRHRKLKIYAARTGRSIRELMLEYIDSLDLE